MRMWKSCFLELIITPLVDFTNGLEYLLCVWCVLSLFENAKNALRKIWHHRNFVKEVNNACLCSCFVHCSDHSWTCIPSWCYGAEGLKVMKNGYFITTFSTGWVGLATAFTPPLNYENSSQTGSWEFDNMLDRKWHPTVCVCVSSTQRQTYREKKSLVGLPAFPSCVFWMCVCVLLARERMLIVGQPR